MVKRIGSIVALWCVVCAGATRAGEPAQTVNRAAGARYGAGWLRSFFLGAHWREAWETPVEVPVLNLELFDGGLRPDHLSGGFETKNLHFRSGNGNVWAFRSVDKDPTRGLDPDTRDSIVGDYFRDQTSTAKPYGPLVASQLLEAAGVLHARPQLAVLPEDPRLGKFHSYAGMLGLIEERIERGLEGATRIADTVTLFERLERRSDERVDARAYLRARLMDVLIGDWDRHLEQWRWARYEKDGERLWEPIPRDRDHAFTRFDGVIPSVVEYYSKIAGFDQSYAPIDKMTYTGRFTDRRFLVALEKRQWEAVTSELVAQLSDQVISDAVHCLPQPVYDKEGADLEKALRSRRDALPAVSREYYRLLADRVDVRGTGQDEDFRIEREANGAVEIAIYLRDGKTESPYFHRTFQTDDTSEIRLYTTGGADRILVDGKTDRTIPVRVVAPAKAVDITDRSSQPSAIHLYAPLPDDPLPASLPGTGPLRGEDRETLQHTHGYETFRDWGSDAFFFPQLSYDPTRGLVVGAILRRTGYGFQLDPYSSVMNLGAAWSTALNQPRLEYNLDLKTRSPVRGLLYVAYSGMDAVKYFGKGNETIRSSAFDSSDFYRVRQGIFVANPAVELPVFGPLRGRAGLLFKHADSVDDSGIITALKPEGSGGMTLGSGEVGLVMNTRNGMFPYTRGLFFQVTGRYTPEIFSNPSAFTKMRGEASASYGGRFVTDLQLNARVAGEKNWGRYPFFESAFIGGAAQSLPLDLTGASTGNLLRGYPLNRFAGDASVVGNAELQVAVGRFNAALPFRFGVLGLADVGRVFVANQSSSRWHTGVGGGFWLGPFISGRDFEFASALKATVVHSDEGTSFYLMTGFTL